MVIDKTATEDDGMVATTRVPLNALLEIKRGLNEFKQQPVVVGGEECWIIPLLDSRKT